MFGRSFQNLGVEFQPQSLPLLFDRIDQLSLRSVKVAGELTFKNTATKRCSFKIKNRIFGCEASKKVAKIAPHVKHDPLGLDCVSV